MNGGIVFDQRLRSVAVVHVPVGNQNALGSVSLLRVSCTNADVVEEAETHAAAALGVVAGRPNEAKRGRYRTIENCINGGYHASGGARRTIERVFRNRRVARRKLAISRQHFAPRQIDILPSMRERQFIVTGRPRRNALESIERAGEFQMIENGMNPGGLFRMARSRIVPA
jgi:hypothetical protein